MKSLSTIYKEIAEGILDIDSGLESDPNVILMGLQKLLKDFKSQCKQHAWSTPATPKAIKIFNEILEIVKNSEPKIRKSWAACLRNPLALIWNYRNNEGISIALCVPEADGKSFDGTFISLKIDPNNSGEKLVWWDTFSGIHSSDAQVKNKYWKDKDGQVYFLPFDGDLSHAYEYLKAWPEYKYS